MSPKGFPVSCLGRCVWLNQLSSETLEMIFARAWGICTILLSPWFFNRLQKWGVNVSFDILRALESHWYLWHIACVQTFLPLSRGKHFCPLIGAAEFAAASRMPCRRGGIFIQYIVWRTSFPRSRQPAYIENFSVLLWERERGRERKSKREERERERPFWCCICSYILKQHLFQCSCICLLRVDRLDCEAHHPVTPKYVMPDEVDCF